MHLFSHLTNRATEVRTSRTAEQATDEAFLDADIRAAQVMAQVMKELAPAGLFTDLITDDARIALLRRYRGGLKH